MTGCVDARRLGVRGDDERAGRRQQRGTCSSVDERVERRGGGRRKATRPTHDHSSREQRRQQRPILPQMRRRGSSIPALQLSDRSSRARGGRQIGVDGRQLSPPPRQLRSDGRRQELLTERTGGSQQRRTRREENGRRTPMEGGRWGVEERRRRVGGDRGTGKADSKYRDRRRVRDSDVVGRGEKQQQCSRMERSSLRVRCTWSWGKLPLLRASLNRRQIAR